MRVKQLLSLSLGIVQIALSPSLLSAASLINVDFGIGTESSKVGFAATGISATDFWNLYTRDDGFGGYRTLGTVSHLKWSDGATSPANLTVANAPGAWLNGLDDPMYNVYLYPFDGGDIVATVSDLPAGRYDIYLYGHGGPGLDSLNAVFQVQAGGRDYGSQATTTGPDWSSPEWQEGRQYVVFRSVGVSANGVSVTVLSHPGAYGLAVINGMQIVRSQSPPEPPTPPTPPTPPSHPLPPTRGTLLNVDFGIGTVSAKIGFAAVGQTDSDFWNLYTRDDGNGGYRTFGQLDNLSWADGTVSTVNLAVNDAPGAWINGLDDPMYNVYLYPFDGGNITATVSNLPTGKYEIYLYGHGGPGLDSLNAVFEVEAGGVNYGTQATTTGPDWVSSVWQEGVQYVVFHGVSIQIRQALTVTSHPGAYGLAVINGMQIFRQ